MGKAIKGRRYATRKSKAEIEAENEEVPATEAADIAATNTEEFSAGFTSNSKAQREQACAMVATLNLTAKVQSTLLRQNIPRLLVGLLNDQDITVRITAAGAMRNLSAAATDKTCDALVDAFAITPLSQMLNKACMAIKIGSMSASNSSEGVKQASSLLLQVISTVMNLCENSETATSQITNDPSVVTNLLTVLQYDQQSQLELVVAAGECLNVVTDCNPALIELMRATPGLCTTLFGYLSNAAMSPLTRTLCAGIVLNVRRAEDGPDILKQVFALLHATLQHDCNATFTQLLPVIAEQAAAQKEKEAAAAAAAEAADAEGAKGASNVVSDTPVGATEALPPQVVEWNDHTKAVRFALELLTNMCAGADEEEQPWEDCEDMEGDSGGDDAGGVEEETPSASADVAELVASSGIMALVLAHVDSEDRSAMCVDDVLTTVGNAHITLLESVQQTALMCATNIIETTPLQEAGQLQVLWERLFAVLGFALPLTHKAGVVLLEDATFALWGLLRKCCKIKPFPLNGSQEQIQELFKLVGDQRSSDVRAHALGMVGIIGRVLATPEVVQACAVTFLAAAQDPSVPVVCEALNSVFDVFSEEDFDGIFRSSGLGEGCKALHPLLKAKIRETRNDFSRDAYLTFQDSLNNLARFIKYKKQHGACT